jgi:hypothetical protein
MVAKRVIVPTAETQHLSAVNFILTQVLVCQFMASTDGVVITNKHDTKNWKCLAQVGHRRQSEWYVNATCVRSEHCIGLLTPQVTGGPSDMPKLAGNEIYSFRLCAIRESGDKHLHP